MSGILLTYKTKALHSLFSEKRLLLFIAVILISALTLFAQLPNGTICSQEYFDLVIGNLEDESLEILDTINPELDVNFSLEVFVIRDETGATNFTYQTLNNNLDIVNAYFHDIGLHFGIGNYTEVPEYAYSNIHDPEITEEMLVKYTVTKKINLFLVDEILLNNIPCYGYTFLPVDTIQNHVFIRKEYLYGNNLSVLLGNFFGLMHTYETVGGAEFVDGSNCDSAGDVICDTYADPGTLFNDMENCKYTGKDIDPKGEFYLPTVSNVMSDSPDHCKCGFSMEQYRRMKFYYKKFRQYLR